MLYWISERTKKETKTTHHVGMIQLEQQVHLGRHPSSVQLLETPNPLLHLDSARRVYARLGDELGHVHLVLPRVTTPSFLLGQLDAPERALPDRLEHVVVARVGAEREVGAVVRLLVVGSELELVVGPLFVEVLLFRRVLGLRDGLFGCCC